MYSMYLSYLNPDFQPHVLVGVVRRGPAAAVMWTVANIEHVAMIFRQDVQLNITNGVNLLTFLVILIFFHCDQWILEWKWNKKLLSQNTINYFKSIKILVLFGDVEAECWLVHFTLTKMSKAYFSNFVFKIRLIRLDVSFKKLKIWVFELTTCWFSVRSHNHYTNWANCDWETQKSFQ